MKLKAVVNRSCSKALVEALNGLRAVVLERVLQRHLSVGEFGPAEFYVQECDFSVCDEGFCEVRLSGVSVNDDRAPNDFRRARDELETIYVELIQKHLPEGRRMQLFVVIILDNPLPGGSTLVEGNSRWIDGAIDM